MISSVSAAFDRLMGTDGLDPIERKRLAAARSATIGDTLPAMFAVAFAVAAALFLTRGHAEGGELVAPWAMAVILLHGLELLVHRAGRGPGEPHPELVVTAFLRGVLWGMALVVVPLDGGLASAAGALIVAMTIASTAALINHPQAALAFAGAFVLFALPGVVALAVRDLVTALLLLVAFPAVAVWLTLRQGKLFFERFVERARVHDGRQVIDLLLNDGGITPLHWLWGFDSAGRINRVSPGFTDATSLNPSQLLGLDFIEFLSGITASDDLLMQQLRRDVMRRQPFTDLELGLVVNEKWWRLSGQPSFDEIGAYVGYVGVATDITERRQAEKRMSLLAHNDALTGLYNRTKFSEALNQCVTRLERYGSSFALLYLDLDNFKLVNDSRGHLAGDKLLVTVANRILANIREADFAARLGGDEFAVILTEAVSEETCAGLAKRLIASISAPIDIDDEPLAVGVSVGIALAPVNGTRPDQLRRNADLALYRAKNDGRSLFRLFENQMDSDARERRMLEMELRDAIRNGELKLQYQPLVSATDKSTSGFEALTRWHHPIRGVISPSEFIPIAEQSSLIAEIGDWTIVEACSMATNWPDHLTVAVNLSAKHFRLSNIADVVRNALRISGLAAERLELEITEGLLMANASEVTAKLSELQEIGVTIVMDDFGTGYSSLSYLLKFPFDKIKIDRSFVAASSSDPMARDILRAIASLGKTLRLKITAEGVETPEQAEFLSDIACHQLQGFYFARPLDQMEMPTYILSNFAATASIGDNAEKSGGDETVDAARRRA